VCGRQVRKAGFAGATVGELKINLFGRARGGPRPSCTPAKQLCCQREREGGREGERKRGREGGRERGRREGNKM